jgi:hypothetical protein
LQEPADRAAQAQAARQAARVVPLVQAAWLAQPLVPVASAVRRARLARAEWWQAAADAAEQAGVLGWARAAEVRPEAAEQAAAEVQAAQAASRALERPVWPGWPV